MTGLGARLGARLGCVVASRLYCRNKVWKVGRKFGTEGKVVPLNTRNRRGRLQSLFQHVDYSGHSTRSSVTARPFTGAHPKSLSSQGPNKLPKRPFQHLRRTPLLRVAPYHHDCLHVRRLRHRPVFTTSTEIEIFATMPQRWADAICFLPQKIGLLCLPQNACHSLMN